MQSMTGYGSGSASHALGTLEVNIRTVNSRFLEISLHDSKIPATVFQTVYQMVKDSLERGKVTVKISFIPAQGGSGRQVHISRLFEQIPPNSPQVANCFTDIKLKHPTSP